jgi:hypothetical protein
MINWIKKAANGRGNAIDYIAVSIFPVTQKNKTIIYQLHFRLSSAAQDDCDLHCNDPVLVGLDSVTKQICFKKVETQGYKFSNVAKSSTVLAVIPSPFERKISAKRYSKTDVIRHNGYWAINAPDFFIDDVAERSANG